MASSRHEERAGRTVPTFSASAANDSDERDLRKQHREHSERHEHHSRHYSHHRHHHPHRSREGDESSGRHSSRHGHHDDHGDERHQRHREDRDRDHHRRHHDNSRSRSHKHARHGSRERSRDRLGDRRHHRPEDSRHREAHHDRGDMQLVLARKYEPNRKEGSGKEATGEAQNDKDDSLYALDTRGDPLIWQFGGNDRRRVPLYYRFGNGRVVLGSDGRRYTFSQEGARELFSAIRSDSDGGVSVFREKNNPLLLRAIQGRISSKAMQTRGVSKKDGGAAATPKNGKTDSGSADFVPLRSSRKRKRGSDIESGSSGSSMDGKSDGSSSDSSSSTDEEEQGEDDNFVVGDAAIESIKEKMIQLSRQVKEKPQDVDAWLELVDLQDHQNQLLGNDTIDWEAATGFRSEQARSKDEITGIASVKLSMLESALGQVQQPSDQERLQLAIMREGAKVWTPKQLAERWTDLARHSNAESGLSFALWKARLDFEVSNLSTFTVDGLKTFLIERLRTLEKEASKQTADIDKMVEIYAQMVYVFLRATRFLYDAGFSDLATASWQALLESSFARPPAEVPGGGLDEFWDSEVPRIGDAGAQGWRSFAAKVKNGQDTEEALIGYGTQRQVLPTVDLAKIVASTGKDDNTNIDEYKPLYESWAIAEKQRTALARLPARIIDEIDDGGYEDVFHVVVFSDIEKLLFSISNPLLPTLQPLLVDAFLLFCQLPPAFGTSIWIETARNDPFLAIVRLTRQPDHLQTASEETIMTTGRKPPDLACDGSQVAVAPDMLFPQPRWFRYLPDWLASPPSAVTEAPVPPHWIASTLRQLVRTFNAEALAPYSLAVDAAVNPDGVKKAARSLLKQYLTNTSLYNAYALAEMSRGNVDVARSVLSSAMPSAKDVEAELSLRQTWAWLELEVGKKNDAVRLLMPSTPNQDHVGTASAAGGSKEEQLISPAQLLRARQALQTGMDYGLSTGPLRRAALYAQSFVLLEYLTSTTNQKQQQPSEIARGNIAAALTAAGIFSDEVQARGHGESTAHELFLQWTARIIFYHASHGSYRPADLQASLQRFVTLFPRNGVFLRLFAWIDPAAASGLARLRPDDPLQQLLDSVVLAREHDCVSSRAFTIRQALQVEHGQGAHAARAAFERALGSSGNLSLGTNPACQGSAQLWQAYVHLIAVEAMNATTTSSSSSSRKGRERRVDRKMAARAKDVYYRAVRACPGSKAVLLEAFGPDTALIAASSSDAGMSPSDLRAVFHTLLSKRLRVHIDLNEVRERARELWENRKR